MYEPLNHEWIQKKKTYCTLWFLLFLTPFIQPAWYKPLLEKLKTHPFSAFWYSSMISTFEVPPPARIWFRGMLHEQMHVTLAVCVHVKVCLWCMQNFLFFSPLSKENLSCACNFYFLTKSTRARPAGHMTVVFWSNRNLLSNFLGFFRSRGVANGGAGGGQTAPPDTKNREGEQKLGRGKRGKGKKKEGKEEKREKGRKKREKEKRKGKRKRGRKREKGKERKREEKKGEKGRKGGEEKGERKGREKKENANKHYVS